MTSRRTIRKQTRQLSGVGLHTGAPAWVRFLPYEPDSEAGIRFRTAGGAGQVIGAKSVVDTRRCTVIEVGSVRFSTVEHVLSAVAGLGITDVTIEFDGPEAPILDGSSAEFARALQDAGIVDLPLVCKPALVTEPIDILGENGERLIALPSDKFSVTVVIEYATRPAIGSQSASYSLGDNYSAEVAPARTYGFLSELDQVRALGLASGASFENCVALLDDGGADPRTPLRFPNELARHKLLDVIGDLALVGRPVVGQVVALRPSHAVNSALARRLSELD